MMGEAAVEAAAPQNLLPKASVSSRPIYRASRDTVNILVN